MTYSDDEPRELIGVGDVSRMLGMHRNTIKRMSPRELPYYRIGSRGDRRYRLAEVTAYLSARRVG